MARRSKGEGTVCKRPDGLWEARLDLGVVDGNRRSKTVYGKTRREATEKLNTLRQQQVQGVNLAAEKQTVGQFLETWVEQTIKPNRREKTYESYDYLCRLHLIPAIGHILLADLSPQQCEWLVNQLRAKDISVNTVRAALRTLSAALNRAVNFGLIARNPIAVIEKPTMEKRPMTIWDKQQAQHFLDTVQGHRLEPLYRLALSLGLRQGELIALTWDDIALEQGTLKIRRAKTEAGVRTLSLPPVLIDVLRRHQDRQQVEQTIQGERWQAHGLVFPSEVGTPLSARNLVRHFKLATEKAGLPDIRFHDLRHSCTSFLVAQGVHPRVAMEILGHSQISITMDVYAHVGGEEQRAALAKVAFGCTEAQEEE